MAAALHAETVCPGGNAKKIAPPWNIQLSHRCAKTHAAAASATRPTPAWRAPPAQPVLLNLYPRKIRNAMQCKKLRRLYGRIPQLVKSNNCGPRKGSAAAAPHTKKWRSFRQQNPSGAAARLKKLLLRTERSLHAGMKPRSANCSRHPAGRLVLRVKEAYVEGLKHKARQCLCHLPQPEIQLRRRSSQHPFAYF